MKKGSRSGGFMSLVKTATKQASLKAKSKTCPKGLSTQCKQGKGTLCLKQRQYDNEWPVFSNTAVNECRVYQPWHHDGDPNFFNGRCVAVSDFTLTSRKLGPGICVDPLANRIFSLKYQDWGAGICKHDYLKKNAAPPKVISRCGFTQYFKKIIPGRLKVEYEDEVLPKFDGPTDLKLLKAVSRATIKMNVGNFK